QLLATGHHVVFLERHGGAAQAVLAKNRKRTFERRQYADLQRALRLRTRRKQQSRRHRGGKGTPKQNTSHYCLPFRRRLLAAGCSVSFPTMECGVMRFAAPAFLMRATNRAHNPNTPSGENSTIARKHAPISVLKRCGSMKSIAKFSSRTKISAP